ncbi:MAG: xanthine dehydrogenase family protein subunit M [Deltaproteobacteria bacterium]|nr:xanthine dehydrogenase family protein subunit M [Deltaproteobacteria bacterium]
MISFEYLTPKSLKEAQADLNKHGTDAKVIAGGTALVIMMKQRLVRPACLISLRSVRGINEIALKDGGLRLGGLATHREVETSVLVRRRWPLLAETYRHVATVRVRNMATVGGGLAHADPNQDPPPSLMVLGARIKASSVSGTREIPIDEFFTDYYETSLRPEEIITEVFVPNPAANSGAAFLKFLPRSADDYATVSAAAVLTMDRSKKTFADARIALGSVGTTPIRAREAEALLVGQPVKAEALREAAEKAKQLVDPVSDFRGSAAYKKEMAGVFVRRALEKALDNLEEKTRASKSRQTSKRRKK